MFLQGKIYTPPRRAAPAKADIVHWLQVAPGYRLSVEFVCAEASIYKTQCREALHVQSIRENGIM